jgi:chemotaxis protein CheX
VDTSYENFIAEITQSIYATMLNIQLTRADGPETEGDNSLLATVQIAGEWTGSVVLALSPDIATASAAAMLQLSSQSVTNADREDVAAELANMIGGNLKSLLPGPSVLSLPTIVVGREIGLQVHNAQIIEDVALRAAAGVLRIRLYEKKHAAAA